MTIAEHAGRSTVSRTVRVGRRDGTAVTRSTRRFAALIVMVLVVLVGCGDDDGATDEDTGADGASGVDGEELAGGGELTFGLGMVMQNLDPHQERTVGDRTYTFALFDRLVRLDNELNPQPMLATSWEFSDDLLELTITIRDDVTFHDGATLDAEAVRVNLERARSDESSTVSGDLAQVESIDVAEDHVVVLTLIEPAPDLPARLAGPAGAMISPTALEEGRDIASDPGLAGTGPYVVEQFTPSETITFVPAPGENWDADVSPLDRATFIVMTDPRAMIAAIQTGEIDVTTVQSNPDRIGEAERIAAEGGFEYHRFPTGALDALLLRSTVPPLDDIRVRQAISHAIDREAIVSHMLQDACTATTQVFPEGWAGHISDFEDPYPYAPEVAGELVDEVGGLGTLEILVNANPAGTPVADAIRDQLLQAGIDAEVTPLAAVEALERFRGGNAHSWQFQFRQSYDPAATVLEGVLGAQLGADDERVRTALAEAQGHAEPDDRLDAIENLAEIVAEQAFMVPLCFVDRHYLAGEYVVGLEQAVLPYDGFTLDLRFIGRDGE